MPTNLTGVNNCSSVDLNWKDYYKEGTRILGAKQNVVNVVSNACAAIGGGCTFNSGYRSPEHNKRVGGAKNSQHLQANAIDLSVPKGKQAEYLTLAICGLKKVNGCKGGLGLYSGGSIHVDTRAATGIWSDDFGEGSVKYLKDGESKNVLYAFRDDAGKGNCAIVGDYGETEAYGDVQRYDPPSTFDFKKLFGGGGSGPQVIDVYNDPVPEYLSFVGGDYDFFDFIYDDEPLTELVYDTDPSVEQTFVLASDGVGFVPTSVGSDNVAGCSGFFGINLFNTCGDNETNVETKSTQSSFWKNPITSISKGLSFTEKEDSGTIIGGSSTNGVFDVHNPTDSARIVDDFYLNRGNFAEGTVPINTNEEVDVVDIAGKSVQLGTYYGVRDAMSPLLFGGAYRAAFRFKTLKRIYNPFLLKSL
ncbi:hypothetical protein COB52_00680 [Candidatus Kaiserbacteria bacterium]|nr:MAG: hypothetical protein COB52_00680 [Candidatus Kaiserbacteria bacterium]